MTVLYPFCQEKKVTDTKFCISREFLFCKISDPDKYKPKNNKGDKKEMYAKIRSAVGRIHIVPIFWDLTGH